MISLADLLSDPRRVEELPPSSIPALMAQCAALQAILTARLTEDPPPEEKAGRDLPTSGDQWLTAEEAAMVSNLGTRWLYRHWQTVPGAKKFSRRRLRFREGPFRRWLQKGA